LQQKGVRVKLDFTAKSLRTLAIPPNKKKASFTDLRTRGLQYELRSSGGFFCYRYTSEWGQRSIPIGKYGVVTIADARGMAITFARMVALGQDPLKLKQDQQRCQTINDFFNDQYLPFAKVHKRSWNSDVSLFNNHLKQSFGHLKLNQLTAWQVRDLLHRKIANGLAKGTVNRMLCLTRHLFNLALEWKVPSLTKNPAKGIRTFEENNKVERYVMPHEALALKQALNQSDNPSLKYIVAFLMVTGARKQEALKARWQDIDIEANVWRIPLAKSGKARFIPLSETARYFLQLIQTHNERALGPMAQACPYVFPNLITLKPFSSIFYAWNTARTRAGLPDVRIHDLRHTFASTLVNQGVPLYEVQRLLGHAQIRTTERYAHLSQSKLQASAGFAGKVFEHILIKPITQRQILG
jgi:site-specific recombinase XerD